MTKRVTLSVGGLLVVGALLAWFAGRPVYRHYKESRALARAKAFIGQKDFRNASLSARQALEVNPRNLEACRVMAGLAELAHAPQVLDWRRRIVELSPTTENRLALAATALRVQGPPYSLAAQTLEELAATAGDVPAYHVMSAELALKLNRPRQAEAQFEAASRLEPTNELHRLNLAVLRLRSTNEVIAADARATLERLRTTTNLAPVALRWLVQDSLSRNDLPGAEGYARELLTQPRAALEDRLLYLDLLRRQERPEFESLLAALQAGASTNATQIYAVSSWMVAHGLAPSAMQWLTNCPPSVQGETLVSMAKVDCYITANDWPGLERFLEDQEWGELEFLRQAFLSHAASERKDNPAADGRWRLAVQRTGERLGPLASLLTMAGAWGRSEAKEDLLWRITKKYPRERWAFQELERVCVASGNTHGLNRLYAAIIANDPNDFIARNNLAATALLLKLNLPKAHQTALELHRQHPQEPGIVSTYAYSLYLQGRAAEGLAALQQLKPEALLDPAVALYYAVLLRAQGQTNEVPRFLALAQNGTLLPEEKALLGNVSNAR